MNSPGDLAATLQAAQPATLCAAAMGELQNVLAEIELPHNPVTLRSHPRLQAWPALDLPAQLGGAACSSPAMARWFRRCGRLDVELRDLIGAGHARLLRQVRGKRFDDVLRDVAGGRAYCAIAITEPEAGSDMQALAATATPVNGGYCIDGVKQYISRIAECTHLIVFARIARATELPLITAFLVARDTPGIGVEPMTPMGLAHVSWGRVTLHAVQVPSELRVGGEGQGMALFHHHFCYWRTMMAATAIGAAETVIEETVRHMKTRHAFGAPIARFTHLQQALAQHVARLRMAWLLVERVASDIDGHRRPVFDAAMAKAEAVEAAIAAAEWGMSTFGAAGYQVAQGLEKRYRDLLGLRVADGTTDVLRGQVARGLLGEEMYAL